MICMISKVNWFICALNQINSFISDFLDLKQGPWEQAQAFQRLLRVVLVDLSGEGLNDLELTVRVVEAKVLISQRPHEIIERGNSVRFQEPSIEALTSALRPEAHLGDIRATCSRLFRHLLDQRSRPLFPLELDGAGQLFLLLIALLLLPLELLLLALELLLFLTLNRPLLILQHGFLILTFLPLSEQGIGIGSIILMADWPSIILVVHAASLRRERQYASILKHFLLKVSWVLLCQDCEQVEALG